MSFAIGEVFAVGDLWRKHELRRLINKDTPEKRQYRNRRDIGVVFLLVFLLGIFYQLNRMDVFLHISRWDNISGESLPLMTDSFSNTLIPREKYLIIYDPTDIQSVLTNHNVSQMIADEKKDFRSVIAYNDFPLDNSYSGVIIATGTLAKVRAMEKVESYVQAGGRALILQNINPNGITPEILSRLGVISATEDVIEHGVEVKTDFMLGLKGFSLDMPVYNNTLTKVVLDPSSVVHLTSLDGTPMIWEHGDGIGKYIIYNGRERDDKVHRGMLSAMLSNIHDDYIFPILDAKLFFIDDFPAPAPEGKFERLYNEVHMSTADFYRKVWWPEMQRHAQQYGLKYTGLIVETYGDQVNGPFHPLASNGARSNLIVYGRELLNMGGELGIHGYNHQSLALPGYIKNEIGYVPWPSKKAMVEALQELNRYIHEVYPEYKFQTYVPPSNILSEEGYEAVKEAFPELKIYSSLYDGLDEEDQYIQDFVRNDNGTFDIPRASAGHNPSTFAKWEEFNLINCKGVFSHFLHPDEIFYEESKDTSWNEMREGLDSFLIETDQRFGWLEPVTASEAALKLADYIDMDYRVERMQDAAGMKIHAWNFHQPLSFVLRTNKEIESVTGGEFTKIQDNAYIIKVKEAETDIFWK